MKIYLIAYEIHEQLYDYSELKDSIRSISDDYQHPFKSLWFIKSDKTLDIKKICDELTEKINPACDKLYIAEIGGPDICHTGWMPKTMWNWFKKSTNI